MRYVFLLLITASLAFPAAAEKPEKYKDPEKYRIWRETQLNKNRPEKPDAPVEGRLKAAVGDVERAYTFKAPKKPDASDISPETPAVTGKPPLKKDLPPLLVVVPDTRGTADSVKLGPIPANAVAAGRGVAFLEPAGSGQGTWNDGSTSAIITDRNGKAIDDVAYFNAVVADIAAKNLADTSRIFIAGSGSGSVLAQRIICRGEASILGAMFFLATTPKPFTESCARKNPLSLMIVHATKDRFFPFDGAPESGAAHARTATPMMSGEESVAFWSKFSGCGKKPSDLSPSDTKPDDGMSVAHLRYDGCAGKKTLDWIKIDGGGHNLPFGAAAALVGGGGTEDFAPRNYDFDLSIAAEDFMKRAGGK